MNFWREWRRNPLGRLSSTKKARACLKNIWCSALLLSLATPLAVPAQQIASVDLTKIPDSHAPDAAVRDTCGAGIADGVVVSSPAERPKILVEVIRLGDDAPRIGEEIEAEVRLQNDGEKPITIPLNTDPGTMEISRNQGHLEWEQGYFTVRLNSDFLQTFALPLFGSDFVPHSLLTIQPGQWIEAKIRFKLEIAHSTNTARKAVSAKLSVEWEQAKEVQPVTNCTDMHENYDYHYEQENPAKIIEIRSQ